MRRGDFEDLVRRHLDGELVPRGFTLIPQPPADWDDTYRAPSTRHDRTSSTAATLPLRLAAIRPASTCGYNSTQASEESAAP